jgi:predicted CXXCH cytochrome family protein
MKPSFKDVEHLLRLAVVMAGGLVLFVILRAIFIPEDFGRLGHYRAAAADDARAQPVVYAGHQVCAECHDSEANTRSAGSHASVTCETCHGPLATHAAEPGQAVLARGDARELCVRCHAANTGKPKWYKAVTVVHHAGEEPCITCHQPHSPRISTEP